MSELNAMAISSNLAGSMSWLLPVLAGAALGAFFYGGLWWTVRRMSTFKEPGLVVLCSMILRTGVSVGGFYVVGEGDLPRLAVCLLGFATMRLVVTRLTAKTSTGAGHAPQP